jgi:hypothetical protein
MKTIYDKVASAFGAYGFNYPDGTTEVNDLGILNWLHAIVRRPWELTGVGTCLDQTLYAFWHLLHEGVAREDIKVIVCAGTGTCGEVHCHATLVFRDGDKWCWVENTMPYPEGNGCFSFGTYLEAVEAVKQALLKAGFVSFKYGFKEDIQIEAWLAKPCGYLEALKPHLPGIWWLRFAPQILWVAKCLGY